MKYVAFLDVLGFRSMVDRSTHEKLARVYQNAFITNATYSLSNGKVIPVSTASGEFVTADLSNPLTSCLIVSDSVILWTENASMLSFVNIFSTVGKILVSGFYTGLPMGGGIAVGELSTLSQAPSQTGKVSIQSVFGKALTHAYEIESKQEWAGCAISQDCIDQYKSESGKYVGNVPELATLDYLKSEKTLVRYPVPMKHNQSEEMWVVNWAKFNRDSISTDTVSSAFTKHNKETDNATVQTKIRNTLAFLEHVNA